MKAEHPLWWHLIDRAYKMFAASGYRIAEHDPQQNDPVAAWMSVARIVLQSAAEATHHCATDGCSKDACYGASRKGSWFFFCTDCWLRDGSRISMTTPKCSMCGGFGFLRERDPTDQDSGNEPCPQCEERGS